MDEGYRYVCEFDEIEDPGARGFELPGTRYPLPGFVVRSADALHAYVNICPHAGQPLNWGPDRFLTRDRTRIMCSSHGAIFDIATGECVEGPCPGARLRPLEVRREGQRVLVRQPAP